MTFDEKLVFQQKIGMRIKELRESKGITQRGLAFDCGIDPPNLFRLENGGTNPTLYTLKKIADKLNVTLSELVAF